MRRRPSLLTLTLAVVASLLLQSLPPVVVQAQQSPAPFPLPPPLPEPPDPGTPFPVEPPPTYVEQPSLVLHAHAGRELVRVGEVVTVTVHVENRGRAAAENVAVRLPLPDGAVALDASAPARTPQGWGWSIGQLQSGQSATLTTTLHLVRMPAGEALLLTPQATATNISAPATVDGGALVDERVPRGQAAELNQATPESDPAEQSPAPEGAAETSTADALQNGATLTATLTAQPQQISNDDVEVLFTPGTRTVLRSPRGRIEVVFPANGFRRPLRLRYRFRERVIPELIAAGKPVPGERANERLGLGAFFLEAVDNQGVQIERFDAPLQLRVRYTAEQLRVLRITPGALRLFWFDPERRIPLPDGAVRQGAWLPLTTRIDPVARTASVEVDHFSAFQLGNDLSASASFVPTLQGWQTSQFTGGAQYSYSMELPSGPAGLAPTLGLNYASDSHDGKAGVLKELQSGWVGRGWTLDAAGAITRNKNACCPDYDHSR